MTLRARDMLLVAALVAGCSSENSTTKPHDDPPLENPPGEDPSDEPPIEEPPPEPDPCEPTSGGPHAILEGEPFSAVVSCATGAELPDDLIVEGLPEGATWDEASRSIVWTPGLDQAGSYEIVLRLPELGETTTERIGVVDNWEDPANVPVLDFLAYPEEHGLPVLHLELDLRELGDAGVAPATVTYGGRVYAAEAEYRGKLYPKKSFTLRFPEEDRFSDPVRGFDGARTIALVSGFDDNSYIRTRLLFELWRRLDAEHLYVRSFHAVVYLNGQYHGLYLLAEHVDGEVPARFGLRKDGNLYLAVDQDANFSALDRLSMPKSSLSVGYEKREGSPPAGEPGAFDDLEELVAFVSGSSDDEFRTRFAELVRRRDYENWWILVMFALAGDNDEKNSLHYHDPEGGPWRVFLAESNWAFGQNGQTVREPATTPRISTHNLLFKRLLDDPAVGLRQRLKQELHGTFALATMLELVDALQAEVKTAALRDERKWGESYATQFSTVGRLDLLDHEGEAAYLRAWIEERWNYLDGRF